jgi:DHA1 family bicyclomycin/chloramphenicol resistance-like MFS transporter
MRRLPPASPWFAALLAALTALAALGIDISLPTLPVAASSLRVPESVIQGTLTTFIAGFAIGQLIWGPISDWIGRRPTIVAGLIVFTLSGIWCVLAGNAHGLLVSRFFQGAGACAGAVVSRAMVRDAFEMQRASSVLSTMTAAMAIAPLVAPIVGAVLLDLVSWRAVYGFLAAAGTVLIAIVMFALPETHARKHRQPIDPATIATNYTTFVTQPGGLGYTLVVGFAFAGMFGYISGSPFVIIDVFHIRADRYPIFFAMTAATLAGGNALNAFLAPRWPIERRLFAGIAGIVAASCVLLAFSIPQAGGVGGFIVPMMGYAFFLGFTIANAIVIAMRSVPAIAGTASALVGFVQMATAGLASYVVGATYDRSSRAVAGAAFAGALCAAAAFAFARSRSTPAELGDDAG